MIKKLLCYIFGHDLSVTPYKIAEHIDKTKVIIPSHEICFRCNNLFYRPLKDFEIPYFIKGLVIFLEEK